MRTCLYLFQNNLRLYDNPSLFYAYQNFGRVVPVLIMPKQANTHIKGEQQEVGVFRQQFLLETVEELQFELLKNGIDLIILEQNEELEKNLEEICEAHHINYTVTSYPRGTYEGDNLGILCKMTAVFTCEDDNLIALEDLPFELDNIPKSFTKFRLKVEENLQIRETISFPKFSKYRNRNKFGITLAFEPISRHPFTAYPFKGGENRAHKRLHYYIWESTKITSYKETRNGLLGLDYSSKLSAYLALGALSPVQVYYALKDFEKTQVKNESTYWLFFELLWREFFLLVGQQNGSKLFKLEGIQEKSKAYTNDPIKFQQWTEGKTENDFINANMKELVKTGYISNRGRQNVASYLIHHLDVDWRWGAAFFEKHLLDYHVLLNWCNWMYLAGVGNDPRDRVFNPILQQKRYDPDGEYCELWNVKVKEYEKQKI